MLSPLTLTAFAAIFPMTSLLPMSIVQSCRCFMRCRNSFAATIWPSFRLWSKCRLRTKPSRGAGGFGGGILERDCSPGPAAIGEWRSPLDGDSFAALQQNGFVIVRNLIADVQANVVQELHALMEKDPRATAIFQGAHDENDEKRKQLPLDQLLETCGEGLRAFLQEIMATIGGSVPASRRPRDVSVLYSMAGCAAQRLHMDYAPRSLDGLTDDGVCRSVSLLRWKTTPRLTPALVPLDMPWIASTRWSRLCWAPATRSSSLATPCMRALRLTTATCASTPTSTATRRRGCVIPMRRGCCWSAASWSARP